MAGGLAGWWLVRSGLPAVESLSIQVHSRGTVVPSHALCLTALVHDPRVHKSKSEKRKEELGKAQVRLLTEKHCSRDCRVEVNC